MEILIHLFQRETTKRLLVLAFLGVTFYLARSLFNVILLTFIFTYLINSLENYIIGKLSRFMKVKNLHKNLITIFIFLLLLTIIVLLLYKYIPILMYQTRGIVNDINELATKTFYNPEGLGKYFTFAIKQIDIPSYSQHGVDFLVKGAANVGKSSVNLFLSIILSMFFMLQKDQVASFIEKFKHSQVGGLFNYISYFGYSFVNSFGKVIQAQLLIAVSNSVLSVITLWIMGFPQLLALWAMIFVLSLVPVAGVVVSFVPLSLIAYKLGGAKEILYVLIMIAILHGIESYILNPKFMSDKTELPVFITFVVLIISEHFMGVWGLLIGIPLFIFIVELLGVKVSDKNHKRKELQKE